MTAATIFLSVVVWDLIYEYASVVYESCVCVCVSAFFVGSCLGFDLGVCMSHVCVCV